jgi:hypothetical protein
MNYAKLDRIALIVLFLWVSQLTLSYPIAQCKPNEDKQQPESTDKPVHKNDKPLPAKRITKELDPLPHSVKQLRRTDQFVPPPPPIQPVYLGVPGIGGQLDFISKDMMSHRLIDLQKALPDYEQELADKIQQMKDKQDKVERFGSLYKEGVVSRNELEAAEKDAQAAVKEVSRFRANFSDLEEERTALSERLKPAKKNSTHAQHSVNDQEARSKAGHR